MKITSVECYKGPFITVKMNTDEGISGFGEAGLSYGCCQTAAWGNCQDFAKLVIGMDPFDTERIYEHLHRHTFWGMNGGVTVSAAMAALDIACWDIKGKALGLPVYKLLGGKTRGAMRTYASQLQTGWKTLVTREDKAVLLYDPEDYDDAVKDAVADGYDAVKIDPCFAGLIPEDFATAYLHRGDNLKGVYPAALRNIAVERIAAAREAGGDKLDIIIEIHGTLDANTSVDLANALEPYRILYYEEPTMPSNPKVFNHIKNRINIPLATGERCYTRWGFRQFFEDRSIDIAQPDLCNTGGITEGKKIADMAYVYDIGVQFHSCGGPIATAAALQLEAVVPNFVMHEFHNGNFQSKFRKGGKYEWMPVNGQFHMCDRPGIGQEMSEEAMATYEKVVISDERASLGL